MARTSQISRRVALTAIFAAPAAVVSAPVKASAIDRLAMVLAEQLADGLTSFNIDPGPDFGKLTREERAQAYLDLFDHSLPRRMATEVDRNLQGLSISDPPRCSRPAMDINEYLAGLAGEQ